MAQAGASLISEQNEGFLNIAKIAYVKNQAGFSVSYVPWLRNISKDLNIAYLSGFYRLDEGYVLGSSLRYFSLGEVDLRDENQQTLGLIRPSEFAFDISIAKSFGPGFALGSSLRYIHSGIIPSTEPQAIINRAGKSVSLDVSAFFKNETYFMDFPATVGIGVQVSNIGTKLGYNGTNSPKLFLPANLSLGLSSSVFPDEESRFSFALDFTKLLVPTPDENGQQNLSNSSLNEDKSVVSGIFSSFGDAPGGVGEELREIGLSTGIEYSYKERIAIRAGYHYEHPTKGENRYLGIGAGLKYSLLSLDFSYLLANPQVSPLANTLRFTLGFQIGEAFKR